jgi:hypothetical protein
MKVRRLSNLFLKQFNADIKFIFITDDLVYPPKFMLEHNNVTYVLNLLILTFVMGRDRKNREFIKLIPIKSQKS